MSNAAEAKMKSIITKYLTMAMYNNGLTSTIDTIKIDPDDGHYQGCEVVFDVPDDAIYPIRIHTRYGVIKGRSFSGVQVTKDLTRAICDPWDEKAQEMLSKLKG